MCRQTVREQQCETCGVFQPYEVEIEWCDELSNKNEEAKARNETLAAPGTCALGLFTRPVLMHVMLEPNFEKTCQSCKHGLAPPTQDRSSERTGVLSPQFKMIAQDHRHNR
ncbi:hypothetical protein PT974_02144 [Cladobotryum mycophilum]|uniref:Uncharacterized protein n=1 Tax=Cladobotryum mycophilum TaxID=491253 RepID=A0ABR0SYK4_9HYPO